MSVAKPSAAEGTADSLMAIFGFKPAYKVFSDQGDWFVAKRVDDGWLVLSGPWPSSAIAEAKIPTR